MTATGRRTTGVRKGNRDARVIASVQSAVLAELARAGWSGLTMDAVSRIANVSRTTVYRRWPSKAALLIEVVEPLLDGYDELSVGDDLFDDALAVLTAIRNNMARPEGRAMFEAAASSAGRLGDTIRRFEMRTVGALQRVVGNALGRGELATDDVDDANLALLLAFHGVVSWEQTHETTPTDDDLRRILRLVLARFAPEIR